MRFLAFWFFLPSLAFGGEWTTADTWKEAAFVTLLTTDCAQTRYEISHPGHTREGNQFIGSYPSKGKINNICAATGIGHFAISYLLPSKFRNDWQWTTIIIESIVVYHNHSLGARIEF